MGNVRWYLVLSRDPFFFFVDYVIRYCIAGTLLPINSNPALFSILGTTFGGDGVSTFALPDLQGRVAVRASVSSDIPL